MFPIAHAVTLRRETYFEALPEGGVGGGGVRRVACLNFKMSCVAVLSKLTSLSEIERKWFVFVGILENVR